MCGYCKKITQNEKIPFYEFTTKKLKKKIIESSSLSKSVLKYRNVCEYMYGTTKKFK